MDARDPDSPDLHDLTRQLTARKADLVGAAAREADLRWTVERLRRELDAAAAEVAVGSERFAAMRTLLDACVASAGPFGLRRRRFRALVRAAARETPTEGPEAARHAVLHAEAERLTARRG